MTTRDFDPVLSAALRDELAARADGAERGAPRRAVLRRPQVWITAATALVLLLATVGLLRLTAPPVPPADPGPQVVDPLTSVTTPGNASYVARAVDVLLHARGVGPSTHEFDVPAGVRGVTAYIACTRGGFTLDLENRTFGFSSGCDRETGTSAASDGVRPGRHELTVRVAKGVRYAVLLIRTPAPTIATGALIDPLTAVRDRRTPDALTGDTRPVLRISGSGSTAVRRVAVPRQRLRALLVCTPSSSAARLRVDGHSAAGCMNSVAHWFDLTPTAGAVPVQVAAEARTAWSLLIVRAPKGAEDSPDSRALPYPQDEGPGAVRARGRGAGAPASGTYVRSTDGIRLVVTCRGTGWLEVATGDGRTSTRGNPCGRTFTTSFGGGDGRGVGKRLRWSAIPHGDVSWTLTISDDG